MIGQESRGLREEMRDKLEVTLVEHGGTMNRGSVKQDREGCVFSINQNIRWPEARDGSEDSAKLTRFRGVSLSL